jgi:hypothetical protein
MVTQLSRVLPGTGLADFCAGGLMAEQPKDSRKRESLDNDVIAGDDDLVGRDLNEHEGGSDAGRQGKKPRDVKDPGSDE